MSDSESNTVSNLRKTLSSKPERNQTGDKEKDAIFVLEILETEEIEFEFRIPKFLNDYVNSLNKREYSKSENNTKNNYNTRKSIIGSVTEEINVIITKKDTLNNSVILEQLKEESNEIDNLIDNRTKVEESNNNNVMNKNNDEDNG